MEPRKTVVCTCQNCGNEAEMTIKCEEVVLESKPDTIVVPPKPKQLKRTITCTRCGNEADMIVDL
jgi:transcription elongation factor Elf1